MGAHMHGCKRSFPFIKAIATVLFSFTSLFLFAQTNLPVFSKFSKPSPEPSVPGDAFSPPTSGAAAKNTPACAEWTRTAGPDESLVITGSNFSTYKGADEGKDTRFVLYSTVGLSKDAKIQRLDGDKAIITLDKGISKWGMYLIWPKNEAGYGTPIAVNKTEAWWVGPDKASAGAVTSVFGRNLTQNNDSLISNVYIKSVNGSGQWAVVTKANPFKVDFIVPAGLSSGDYEIWVHNGHGGSYGWSGPLKLTVAAATPWTNTIINVKNYGATGNGSTDDTGPIQKAITAARNSPYSTLYFPAGTYMVSSNLDASNNQKWMGDGKDKTIIKCSSSFSTSAYGLLFCGGGVTNFSVQDMTFDGNNNYKGKLEKPIFVRSSTDVQFTNVRFSFPNFSIIDLHQSYRVFLNYCELSGNNCFLGNCSQLFIDHCAFRITNDADVMLHTWGGVGVSMTNSTCKDYDNSNPNDGAGWGKGRFFVGAGVWGSNRLTYLGNNTTTDLTVRLNGPDLNSGEQFLWEGNFTSWAGTVSSSTDLVTSLNGFSKTYDHTEYAVIVGGKGLGQSRRVVATGNGTITVDEPWNVAPDNTSIINIGAFTDRVAIYKNYLDAKSYAATNTDHIASAGIEPYGGMFNMVATDNTMSEVREGISTWATQHDIGLEPNYFNLFANNKFIKCRWALYNEPNVYTPANSSAILGIIYRNNTVQDPVVSGVLSVLRTNQYPVLDGIVYEHNSFNNAPVGIDSWDGGVQNQIVYANTFNHGGAQGAAVKISPKIALRENTYQGFSSPYSGTANNVIEAPYHVLELTGYDNTTVVQSDFTIWNSGTTALNWSASSNASWLTLSATSGTIQNEAATSQIKISANPKGMANGTYTATITVNASGQVKNYTVLFTITTPTNTPPQVSLTSPVNNATATAPASITLTAAASDADGISKVEFFNGTTKIGEVTASPYSIQWTGVTAGTYTLTAKATDKLGATNTSSAVSISVSNTTQTVATSCANTGSITWQYWSNLSSSGSQDISTIPLSTTPSGTRALNSFASPVNFSDNYGARTYGYVCVPATGNYTFYIAGDDYAELWLSTDDNAANKQKIASAPGWTYENEYTKYASQKSVAIYLQAGQRYYIEALHREMGAGDHMSVGWQLPDGTMERPINGAHLIPYDGKVTTTPANTPPQVSLTSPVNNATATAPANITLTAAASDADGISKVEFFNGTTKIGEATASPYSIQWNNVVAGAYVLMAKATDKLGLSATSATVSINVNAAQTVVTSCANTGSITWDYWYNLYGNQGVESVPVNTTPNGTRALTSFASPVNFSDNFGSRVRGYVCVPTTGNYTFYVAGDDFAELWLSTDDNAANKQKIASAPGWTYQNEYTRYASQKSASIYLQAGRRYYIEALQREWGAGDHLSVAWQMPDGKMEQPIAGSHLIPYDGQNAAAIANNTAVELQGKIDLVSSVPEINASPNPFATQTNISFTVPQNATVALQVYTLQGILVKTLYKGEAQAGKRYQYDFNGSSLASGIYVCRLTYGKEIIQKRIMLIK